MRKVLLSLGLMVCVAFAANAQQMWVGGSLGVTSLDPKEGDSSTSFTVMPEFGYQINDNWSVGLVLGYSEADVTDGMLRDTKKVFGVNPYVRYSFLTGEIGNLFVEGTVGYAMESYKDSDDEENYLSIGLRPGVNVNISENLSLVGRFGFFGYERATEAEVNTLSFGIDATEVSLGIVYKF